MAVYLGSEKVDIHGLVIEKNEVVKNGTFTPAENVLQIEIPVGINFTYFMLYPMSSVVGRGIKASNTILLDIDKVASITATNNSGSALATSANTYNFATSDTEIYVIINNTRITKNISNNIKIITNNPNGTCLGYFLADVTYQWVAW